MTSARSIVMPAPYVRYWVKIQAAVPQVSTVSASRPQSDLTTGTPSDRGLSCSDLPSVHCTTHRPTGAAQENPQ